VLSALCLAGCGNKKEQPAASRPPQLPRAVAAALAERSDEIAQALDANDTCRASSLAHTMQAQTIAAINARRVPAAFQEPLASAVTDLASRIQCVPAPVHPGNGRKERGKGKHKEND
jgi:hypothetical protein